MNLQIDVFFFDDDYDDFRLTNFRILPSFSLLFRLKNFQLLSDMFMISSFR